MRLTMRGASELFVQEVDLYTTFTDEARQCYLCIQVARAWADDGKLDRIALISRQLGCESGVVKHLYEV